MALMAGAQQGISMARGPEAPGAAGRQGEEQALESLLHRAAGADPEERPALKTALAALANGDTLLAEALLSRRWKPAGGSGWRQSSVAGPDAVSSIRECGTSAWEGRR